MLAEPNTGGEADRFLSNNRLKKEIIQPPKFLVQSCSYISFDRLIRELTKN